VKLAPELREAARRYEEQRPELRIEFLAAVDEAMERMVRIAKHLGSPPAIDPTLGIKRAFVKRFPFSVYFLELPPAFVCSPRTVGAARSTGATASDTRGTWPGVAALYRPELPLELTTAQLLASHDVSPEAAT